MPIYYNNCTVLSCLTCNSFDKSFGDCFIFYCYLYYEANLKNLLRGEDIFNKLKTVRTGRTPSDM